MITNPQDPAVIATSHLLQMFTGLTTAVAEPNLLLLAKKKGWERPYGHPFRDRRCRPVPALEAKIVVQHFGQCVDFEIKAPRWIADIAEQWGNTGPHVHPNGYFGNAFSINLTGDGAAYVDWTERYATLIKTFP